MKETVRKAIEDWANEPVCGRLGLREVDDLTRKIVAVLDTKLKTQRTYIDLLVKTGKRSEDEVTRLRAREPGIGLGNLTRVELIGTLAAVSVICGSAPGAPPVTLLTAASKLEAALDMDIILRDE